nr:helix-turn-helix domain-containing protein [Rhizobium laguerreae]
MNVVSNIAKSQVALSVGALLAEARLARGYSLDDVAETTGLTVAEVTALENDADFDASRDPKDRIRSRDSRKDMRCPALTSLNSYFQGCTSPRKMGAATHGSRFKRILFNSGALTKYGWTRSFPERLKSYAEPQASSSPDRASAWGEIRTARFGQSKRRPAPRPARHSPDLNPIEVGFQVVLCDWSPCEPNT